MRSFHLAVVVLSLALLTSLVTAALASPASIHGQVLAPDGSPAAGVKVGSDGGYGPLLLPNGPKPGPLVNSSAAWPAPGAPDTAGWYLNTVTDAQGQFTLPPPDPALGTWNGPALVFAVDADHDLVGAGIVNDPATPVTVKLAPAAYLVAEVTDQDGQPVPGISLPIYAEIGIQGPRRLLSARWESDTQGHLRLGPLPAAMGLVIFPTLDTLRLLLDTSWTNAQFFTLAPGEERTVPPVRISPHGRRVTGYVRDANQQPVAGAVVYGQGVEKPAVTDKEGRFEIAGLNTRDPWLVARHPTEALFGAVDMTAGRDTEPTVVLGQTGSVSGQIVDAAGQPVTGAGIAVRCLSIVPDFRSLPGVGPLQFIDGLHLQVDAAGKWQAEGLIPGMTYVVLVWNPATGDATEYPEFSLQSGQAMDLGQATPKPRPVYHPPPPLPGAVVAPPPG